MSLKNSSIDNLVNWLKKGHEYTRSYEKGAFISPKIETRDDEFSGRGIYATKPISSNELLIHIPHSFLLNVRTVLFHIEQYGKSLNLSEKVYKPVETKDFPTDAFTNIYEQLTNEELLKLNSFQIVSLFLCFEKLLQKESFWHPFIDSLPVLEAFHLVPMVWCATQEHRMPSILNSLPSSTAQHTEKIYHNFSRDYNVVRELIREKMKETNPNYDEIEALVASRILPKKLFLWAWMCINSRCLFMDIPEKESREDKWTMAPYVDLVNHSSDDHCLIKIDATGFSFLSMRNYCADEQIFLCYGPYSNEFLLCEYGFMLPNNKWNDLDITHYILPMLSKEQKHYLQATGYFGDYTLNKPQGISFRTEVALAMLQEPHPGKSKRVSAYIQGLYDGSAYEAKNRQLVISLLTDVLRKTEEQIEKAYFTQDKEDALQKILKQSIITIYTDKKTLVSDVLQDYGKFS